MSIIIANWKMKLGLHESHDLADSLRNFKADDKEIVICPSFASLSNVGKILKQGKIKLGAQDCFWESKGAYTGEVSPQELKEAGCEFVILGHSERRKFFNETDEVIHRKVKAALSAGLVPVICVGETFEQRQQGATDYILIKQVAGALEGISADFRQRIIIAYEPVWVIGTGQAIMPEQAELAHEVINQTLIDLFPSQSIRKIFSIIYGGSIDSENIFSFTSLPIIDGVLVGAASLNAKDFIELINNA